MHDCSCLSREIHPGFFHQAELLEIIAEPLRSQSEPDLHKNRITGILHSFHECLRPVSSYFVAPDSPILYNLISRAHKCIIQIDYPFFQAGAGGDDLKGGSRFIGIIDTPVSPHLIQKFLLFFLRGGRYAFRQFKRLIQIKFRPVDHRIDLPVLRVHQDDGHFIRLFFLHRLLCHLLCVFLDIIIDADLKRISR